METKMRSHWMEHAGKQIFYQDFSGHDILHSDAVQIELSAVQEVVTAQPKGSTRVLADFRDTTIGKDLIDLLTASSAKTKIYVMKTAVLGVTGTKRMLVNMLMNLTGQKLVVFEDEQQALDWLAQD
ncbi:MAG: hypothetical protein Fur0035_03430 [Anaerolineales bacterium]